VHTNDLHGHVERAAAVSAVVERQRMEQPNTLFLDGGDCISGTPLSTVFQGRPIFEIMSAMGYDAAVVGNHEYDHGWQLIEEFRELATFPLLCANAKDPAGALLADEEFAVFETGGVRIGVIGLITKDVPTLTQKSCITQKSCSAGCSFEDPIAAARRLVPKVRERADVVIVLSHCGVQVDAAIAGAVEGIDLIVGGHSHTELKSALLVGDTHIVQAKCYFERVGIVDFVWDEETGTISEFTSRLVVIDADTMPSDPKVRELVATWEEKVDAQVAEVIGTSGGLARKALRSRIEHIYKELLGCDFGYQNMGGIRAVIAPGDIRIRDVWTVLPFDNSLVKLTLPGDKLHKYARRRLGDRFDPEAEYTIATNSYVADQQEKYFGITDAKVEDTGLLMRDEVVKWVRENGGFAPKSGKDDQKDESDGGSEPDDKR